MERQRVGVVASARRWRAIVLMAWGPLAVLTGCGSDSGTGDPGDARLPAAAGAELEVSFERTDGLGPDFVLQDGAGKAAYLLTPRLGDVKPSARPIEGNEYARRAAAMLLEPGESLTFVMPADLEDGVYALCSTADECVPLEVS